MSESGRPAFPTRQAAEARICRRHPPWRGSVSRCRRYRRRKNRWHSRWRILPASSSRCGSRFHSAANSALLRKNPAIRRQREVCRALDLFQAGPDAHARFPPACVGAALPAGIPHPRAGHSAFLYGARRAGRIGTLPVPEVPWLRPSPGCPAVPGAYFPRQPRRG